MKQHTLRLMLFGIALAVLLLVPACARQLQPVRIEEITFQSGSFHVVGDLRFPEGKAPFPVVLFVHGSGPADRTGFGMYLPVMERMLRLGFAVFSWDKPGTGESTGQLNERRVIHQRAQIVLDAIDVMKEHPDIDHRWIGLWGVSQGGYVMPLALAQTEDIAFMICVSCAGTAGDDQITYQIIFQAICDGVPPGKDAELKRLLSELERARIFETYEEYVHYREVLSALEEIGSKTTTGFGVREVIPEQAWQVNDPETEVWWNPLRVIEQVRFPVLVINGDKDTNGDPIQGAYAWRKALEQAGNPNFQVEILPGINHFMLASESCCIEKQMQTFNQVLQDQGYGTVDESIELFLQEPGLHTPLSALPYAPEYLDLIEEWLRNLKT
ncbi:MAG TPA: alpha/beta fold hydrolase [Anaerolineales bacterium]|nr:alpha/beta fold hydrolase [Anaerolineales bacterium]